MSITIRYPNGTTVECSTASEAADFARMAGFIGRFESTPHPDDEPRKATEEEEKDKKKATAGDVRAWYHQEINMDVSLSDSQRDLALLVLGEVYRDPQTANQIALRCGTTVWHIMKGLNLLKEREMVVKDHHGVWTLNMCRQRNVYLGEDAGIRLNVYDGYTNKIQSSDDITEKGKIFALAILNQLYGGPKNISQLLVGASHMTDGQVRYGIATLKGLDMIVKNDQGLWDINTGP